MLVRPYLAADFDALYAVEERCFAPLFRFTRRYMRQLLGSRQAAAWIAEEEGTLAGFAIVEWTLEEEKKAAYIDTIEVDPQWRRRGIAAELLWRVEESARAAAACTIWLHVDEDNAGAIRLYESAGYICQGRHEDFYPQGRAALAFAKSLSSCDVAADAHQQPPAKGAVH